MKEYKVIYYDQNGKWVLWEILEEEEARKNYNNYNKIGNGFAVLTTTTPAPEEFQYLIDSKERMK